MAELLKNKLGLKVLTDTGFSDFDGLLVKSIRELLHIKLSKTEIKCTPDHKIFLQNLSNKEAKDLNIGDEVYTSYGFETVIDISSIPEEQTYDVFNVKNNHRFYANDILVKNCEFLVFDETLINSLKLAEMEGTNPQLHMGQVRWYKKPDPHKSYVVALDPSMGTGGDFSAIQVIELPTYEQVAEWQHNQTAIPGQIRILRDICSYLKEVLNSDTSIYWSVENNGLGEAALLVIQDFGEENIPGLFISEPIRKGHVRKFRKGFNTTHGSKTTACARLKTMVENNQLTLHSKPLISELKAFVAAGSSFQAKQGHTDDLVSALLLSLRIITIMKDWDVNVYNTFTQIELEEDYEAPMPIFVSSNY